MLTKRSDSRYWYAEAYLNGRRHRISTKTRDKREAQIFEAKWIADLLSRQQDGLQPSMTLAEALARYNLEALEPKQPSMRTFQKQRSLMKVISKEVGPGTRLEDITGATLANWRYDMLQSGLAPATVNKRLGLVRAVLRRAHAEWCCIRSVPKVSMVKLPPTEERYLTDAEVDRLIAYSSPALARLIVFLAGSGARLGEALNLTWQHVDLSGERAFVRFPRTKGGKAHGLPVSLRTTNMLRDLYQEYQPEPSDHVFVYMDRSGRMQPYRYPHTAFETARRRAGVGCTIHTIRHTYAANLVRKGVSLFVVQKLLNHASPKQTMRYASLAPDNLINAVAQLD